MVTLIEVEDNVHAAVETECPLICILASAPAEVTTADDAEEATEQVEEEASLLSRNSFRRAVLLGLGTGSAFAAEQFSSELAALELTDTNGAVWLCELACACGKGASTASPSASKATEFDIDACNGGGAASGGVAGGAGVGVIDNLVMAEVAALARWASVSPAPDVASSSSCFDRTPALSLCLEVRLFPAAMLLVLGPSLG